MFWALSAALFCALAVQELRWSSVSPDRALRSIRWRHVDKQRLACWSVAAALLLWTPLDMWWMERQLTAPVRLLTALPSARVSCKTFDVHLDGAISAYARASEGEVVIRYGWCSRMMSYRRHPQRASPQELEALNILTHEAMHLLGEVDEARTECRAVQRNARMARYMGVADAFARSNAHEYYAELYPTPLLQRYFSSECASGKALDEHLDDPPW